MTYPDRCTYREWIGVIALAEIAIVGAGLAGLAAAINCARAGHKVTVLEKYKKVGGNPDSHPSVDSTPMYPERLGRFIGVELKPPHVTPTRILDFDVFGKRYAMDGGIISLQAVERGSRSTSIENHLYEAAKSEGAKFEFGWELRSQADVAELPPNSIIATGLHPEAFLALNIPFRQTYGYTSLTRYEGEPKAAAYFGDHTRDYCYFANANGLAYAIFFDRSKPAGRDALERWSLQLAEEKGAEFANWIPLEGVVAVKSWDNPRLFMGDKILAGTLASMNDPIFLFGVHASLASGRIAAIAVDDKAEAYRLFKDILSFYKAAWCMERLTGIMPTSLRRRALRLFFDIAIRKPQVYGKMTLYQIPGMRWI
jgi:hypothetical protein